MLINHSIKLLNIKQKKKKIQRMLKKQWMNTMIEVYCPIIQIKDFKELTYWMLIEKYLQINNKELNHFI